MSLKIMTAVPHAIKRDADGILLRHRRLGLDDDGDGESGLDRQLEDFQAGIRRFVRRVRRIALRRPSSAPPKAPWIEYYRPPISMPAAARPQAPSDATARQANTLAREQALGFDS